MLLTVFDPGKLVSELTPLLLGHTIKNVRTHGNDNVVVEIETGKEISIFSGGTNTDYVCKELKRVIEGYAINKVEYGPEFLRIICDDDTEFNMEWPKPMAADAVNSHLAAEALLWQ